MMKMLNKIKEVVEKKPNRIAYKVGNKSITYKELWSLADKYAQLLKRQGTSPVVIFGHKDINVVISIIACLMANRTYVPVDECTPLYRVKQIIELTGCSLVLTDNDINIEKVDCFSLEELKRFENNSINENENDIVYVIFTSGSTGVPKGVPISKTNLNNFVDWISHLYPLREYNNIKVLNQASFSFDLSVADFYYSLCNGHTLMAFNNRINDGYDEFFSLMLEVNVAVMTPTFMKLCLLNGDFNEGNYPNLQCVYFCGEPLDVKEVQKIYSKFPNLKIINAYGPTEATSAVSGIIITKEMADDSELLPVGEMNNLATSVEIINGEIVLKGKSVFGGYIGDYVGGYYYEKGMNCYKTGDIGYIEDGKLYCKGRIDNQIKYKGYRIELSDIEYNIKLIRGVRDSVVIAKYDDNSSVKTIKAFVVVDNNLDVSNIRKKLKKYIPEYMIPKTIKIIGRIPVNQNGKVDRRALMEL